MDITNLGTIGELVGGVAVIGSLIYVGLQVRQNTTVTRAASHQAITDSFNEINPSVAREPILADVWRRGRTDRASLSETEQTQFDTLYPAVFRVFETLYYQNVVGAGERQLLQAEERTLKAQFAFSGVRAWWRENPFSLDSEFREYVESFFPETSSAPKEV